MTDPNTIPPLVYIFVVPIAIIGALGLLMLALILLPLTLLFFSLIPLALVAFEGASQYWLLLTGAMWIAAIWVWIKFPG